MKKGTDIAASLWVAASRSLHLPTITLKVYTETLTGLSRICSPEGLNNTLLHQAYALENSSHSGNGGQNAHSKDRPGGEEPPIVRPPLIVQLNNQGSRTPLIVWDQLTCHPGVMSSLWPPPTISTLNLFFLCFYSPKPNFYYRMLYICLFVYHMKLPIPQR